MGDSYQEQRELFRTLCKEEDESAFDPHFSVPQSEPTILRFYTVDGQQVNAPTDKAFWGRCNQYHEMCPYAFSGGECNLIWFQTRIIWPDFDPVCPLAYREQI